MKAIVNGCIVFAVIVMGGATLRAETAYDNTANYTGTYFSFTNGQSVGNQIVLATANLYLNGFSLIYYTGTAPSESATMDVQFYLNDGTPFNGYATPGTLLYDSGLLNVGAFGNVGAVPLDFSEADLYSPSLPGAVALTGALPTNEFTFVITFNNLNEGDDLGILLYTNAAVGLNYHDYWYNTGGGWSLMTNSLSSSMGAIFSVPEPSTNALFAASGLVAGIFGLAAWRKRKAAKA